MARRRPMHIPHVSAPRSRARRAMRSIAAIAVLTAAVVATTLPSDAASTGVTVTLSVPSTTVLDTSGCPATAQRFGVVQPGTSAVTSAACTITFGSTNDSSMLKLYQQDLGGDAMVSRTAGGDDTGFGTNGNRAIAFPEGAATGKWVSLAPDGNYVVGGHVGTDQAIALAKISPTGTMVGAFGDGGTGRKVQNFYVDAGADDYEDETGSYGYVQPDGKTVGVGWTNWNDARLDDGIIYRFTSTGQPDPTFGTGGQVLVDSAGWDQLWGIAPVDGGKYLAVGCSCQFGPSNILLVRLNPDGTRDTSFGTNGVIDTAWGTNGSIIQTIVPVSGDKFLVGGTRDNGSGNAAYVARINANGSIDTTYGVSGYRDLPAYSGIGRVSLASADGSLWVPGHFANGGAGTDFGVTRLTAAGAIDTSWNTTGSAATGYTGAANDYGYAALSLGPDDVLVTGGTTAGTGDFHATAFGNGGLDTAFSTDGKHTVDFTGAFDYSVHAIHGLDGRIVIAGMATSGGVSTFGVHVFTGAGTVPDYGGAAVFGSGATQSAFGACLEARSGAGITGGWTVDPGASCTAVAGDPWNAVADDASQPTAKIAGTTTPGVTNASATFRFGVKNGTNLPPGKYIAPVYLDVIAPYA